MSGPGGYAARTAAFFNAAMDRDLDKLLDDLDLPGHRAVAEHWLGLYRRHRRIPSLAEIDPLHFPKALADAWIVDATDKGRFRFRLMGQTLVEWYGRSPKGLYYEDLFPAAMVSILIEQSQQVLTRPCAGFQRMHTQAPERHWPRFFERLTFPLRGADGQMCHILGNSIFNRDRDGDVAAQINHWYPIA